MSGTYLHLVAIFLKNMTVSTFVAGDKTSIEAIPSVQSATSF